MGGKARLRPLPSALATVLRDRADYRVHDAGINQAVELAEAERKKTDSTQAGGPVRPAPGPAPIPGVGPSPEAGAQGAPAPQPAPAPRNPARRDTGAARPAQ
jgi:hypothetical protein